MSIRHILAPGHRGAGPLPCRAPARGASGAGTTPGTTPGTAPSAAALDRQLSEALLSAPTPDAQDPRDVALLSRRVLSQLVTAEHAPGPLPAAHVLSARAEPWAWGAGFALALLGCAVAGYALAPGLDEASFVAWAGLDLLGGF